MQTAKAQDNASIPARMAAPRSVGSNLPARVASMPIEPPHPREVEDKLQFRTAAQYKKAVMLAERYLWQARLAIDRRAGTVKKAERQAKQDHEETGGNFQRQLAQAQSRYKSYIEQCHGKHRQAIYQARVSASQAEDIYKTALASVPGYGQLRLRAMALNDSRAVTLSLVSSYKAALGPDGLGNMHIFLAGLDKTIDLARDRSSVVPMQFAESLLKAVVQRQLRNVAADKEEVERLKVAGGGRLMLIQSFLAEQTLDTTPASVRTAYFAVHEWLGKASGTPFDLALDRLKRDVESLIRKEQSHLEHQIETALQHSDNLHLLRPVAESYDRAQRVLISSEQAAKNVLHQEISRIEVQLEKEIQLADAMVIGMDHTAARRLAEAKRAYNGARKMAGRWQRVLEELQEIGAWQRFIWRLTENFDLDCFWLDLRAKQMNRT
jgi:hypothetical protein